MPNGALPYEGDARSQRRGQDEYWRLVAERIGQDPLEPHVLLAPIWRTKPADENGTSARCRDPLGRVPTAVGVPAIGYPLGALRSGSTPAAPYFRFSRMPAAAGNLIVCYWHITPCSLFLHWARVC